MQIQNIKTNSHSIISSSNTDFLQGDITTAMPVFNITLLNATYVSNCTVSGIMLMSFLTAGSNVLVHAGAYTVMFIHLNSKILKMKP
jgi:hypothetical protein